MRTESGRDVHDGRPDSRVSEVEVVVIGAGQAGLSAAYHLSRRGFAPYRDFVVLDAGSAPGGAWQHRWPSLRMESVHGVHRLPGLAAPDAADRRSASEVIPDYFARYERGFELPVLRPAPVRAVRRDARGLLLVESSAGTFATGSVINATGTWTRPFRPYYPGRELFTGRQWHTADYRAAEEFRDRHVIVVGGGISAVEHLTELAEVTTTTWVTRRPPVFTGTEFGPEHGRAAVAEAERRIRTGLPPSSVVALTGLPAIPSVRRAHERGVLHRLPMFDRIVPTGVEWDGDTHSGPDRVEAGAILWATGFRPALGHLGPLGIREAGGGVRMDGTRVLAEPRLHLLGYGPSASTVGANRAGRQAVLAITGERSASTAA